MKDKYYVYIGVGLLVVVLIIYGIYRHYNNTPQPVSITTTTTQTATTTPTPVPSVTYGGKLSYGKAILTYKNRFQFVGCRGTPGVISVRAGSPVMLDNRSTTTATIKADGSTFIIPGLSYAVFYPARLTAAGTDLADSNITCNGGGAATLNVEK